MVEPRPPGLAQAPPALLNCIFRRDKWARDAASSPAADLSGAPAPHVNRSEAASRDEPIQRYALTALNNQIRKVEQAAKGTRNQTLTDAALSLGHLVAAGALSETVVRQFLENAGHACGLSKDDGIASVRSTIKSGLRAGMERPADLTKIGRRSDARRRSSTARLTSIGDQPSQQGGAGRLGDHADGGEPLTDLGNAQRFVKRHRGSFRSCPVLGWLAWVGARCR